MNKKLEAIANKASADLLALIKDGEAKILEAWNSAEEEAQIQESKPKFKLGLAIVLDLDKDTMDTSLSFGIKHTLTISGEMPDPTQPKLPLEVDELPAGTVTIKTPGAEPVTVTTEQFANASKKLSATARALNFIAKDN